VARRAIAGVTREPEAGEAEEPENDEGGERWRSAFDEEDAGGGDSGDENPG
jgi:hypothetical protein